MGKTSISWTEETWNPARGCTRVSPGCQHCYAEQIAGRFSGPGQAFDGFAYRLTRVGKAATEGRWSGRVELVPDILPRPLAWRRPRRVFVNSMSDLFHEQLSNEAIAAVFGVMAAADLHTFQVLTKRADRMKDWFRWIEDRGVDPGGFDQRPLVCWQEARDACPRLYGGPWDDPFLSGTRRIPWPLPNVWLGVSVEDRRYGLPRIETLTECPAAVRFLSVEPLLEDLGELDLFGIQWVIAGCESGPGARSCQVDWLRRVRDASAAQGVAFFLKQAVRTIAVGQSVITPSVTVIGEGDGSRTKSGGVIELPYLDGVQHCRFPEVTR